MIECSLVNLWSLTGLTRGQCPVFAQKGILFPPVASPDRTKASHGASIGAFFRGEYNTYNASKMTVAEKY
jgi:hypothetical protein